MSNEVTRDVLTQALDQFVSDLEDLQETGEFDTKRSRQLEVARRLLDELNSDRARLAG